MYAIISDRQIVKVSNLPFTAEEQAKYFNEYHDLHHIPDISVAEALYNIIIERNDYIW